MNLEGLSSNYRESVHNDHLGRLWLSHQSRRWLGTAQENREATHKSHHILDEPCSCHIYPCEQGLGCRVISHPHKVVKSAMSHSIKILWAQICCNHWGTLAPSPAQLIQLGTRWMLATLTTGTSCPAFCLSVL